MCVTSSFLIKYLDVKTIFDKIMCKITSKASDRDNGQSFAECNKKPLQTTVRGINVTHLNKNPRSLSEF